MSTDRLSDDLTALLSEDVRENPVFNELLQRSFEENAFTEEERSLYRMILDRVVTEYSVRPGMHTIHMIAAQRVAWVTMLLLKRDGSARGDVLYWADYDKLNRVLRDFMDRLINEAKLADVEEAFKRELYRAAVVSCRDVIDRLPIDDATKVEAGNAVANLIAARLSPTD